MKTDARGTIKGIAVRLAAGIVRARGEQAGAGVSAPAVNLSPRLMRPGLPAPEYVLRRVASRSVELRRVSSLGVSNQSVGSECVSRRASPDPKPVNPSPRLALAHVFACCKAAAAKSRVSRLLGRTARRTVKASCSASVASTSVVSVSRPVTVPRARLH